MTGLDEKLAVVTGGTRGVGAAIADALEADGVRVERVGRSRCDVTRPEDVTALAQEVGPVDILVNAAGVFGPIARVQDVDRTAWLEAFAIDFQGPFLTCHAFIGGMVAKGWGRIINVTSAASLQPPGATNSVYATAKTALNQLTRHLAAELDGTGVTANVLHPGDIKTDMWADIRDQAARMGAEGELFQQWVQWVEKTGGDPPAKVGELVLRICESNANGEFHWIEDPLQAPIPSWEKPSFVQPWAE